MLNVCSRCGQFDDPITQIGLPPSFSSPCAVFADPNLSWSVSIHWRLLSAIMVFHAIVLNFDKEIISDLKNNLLVLSCQQMSQCLGNSLAPNQTWIAALNNCDNNDLHTSSALYVLLLKQVCWDEWKFHPAKRFKFVFLHDSDSCKREQIIWSWLKAASNLMKMCRNAEKMSDIYRPLKCRPPDLP